MSNSNSSHHFSGSSVCMNCNAEIKKERGGYLINVYNLNTKWHETQEEQLCLVCFNELANKLKEESNL